MEKEMKNLVTGMFISEIMLTVSQKVTGSTFGYLYL